MGAWGPNSNEPDQENYFDDEGQDYDDLPGGDDDEVDTTVIQTDSQIPDAPAVAPLTTLSLPAQSVAPLGPLVPADSPPTGQADGSVLVFDKTQYLKLIDSVSQVRDDLENGFLHAGPNIQFGQAMGGEVHIGNAEWGPAKKLSEALGVMGGSAADLNNKFDSDWQKYLQNLNKATEVFEETNDLATYEASKFATDYPGLAGSGSYPDTSGATDTGTDTGSDSSGTDSSGTDSSDTDSSGSDSGDGSDTDSSDSGSDSDTTSSSTGDSSDTDTTSSDSGDGSDSSSSDSGDGSNPDSTGSSSGDGSDMDSSGSSSGDGWGSGTTGSDWGEGIDSEPSSSSVPDTSGAPAEPSSSTGAVAPSTPVTAVPTTPAVPAQPSSPASGTSSVPATPAQSSTPATPSEPWAFPGDSGSVDTGSTGWEYSPDVPEDGECPAEDGSDWSPPHPGPYPGMGPQHFAHAAGDGGGWRHPHPGPDGGSWRHPHPEPDGAAEGSNSQ